MDTVQYVICVVDCGYYTMRSHWGKNYLFAGGGISLRKDVSVFWWWDLTGEKPMCVLEVGFHWGKTYV